MSVIIEDVKKRSKASKKGVCAGDILLSINGNEIVDVLDYRFYQVNSKLELEIQKPDGRISKVKIKKQEYEELGLEFSSYLMDKEHSCRNKCIFCFIDQLPEGMRDTLYFKDDDSRLSFLFGNYITLTNLTEHEISRIIKMHISPINISVHTTNPELRCKMMNNRFAGSSLDALRCFAEAGLSMNCQIVACPGVNDGDELLRTLTDLEKLGVECIAVVPVGLTRYRENLYPLTPYTPETAAQTLDLIESFGDKMKEKYGRRTVYAADEFYIKAGRELPDSDYYEGYPALENGVGLWALMKSEVESALNDIACFEGEPRKVSLATGVAAYSLLRYICDLCEQKYKGLNCAVYPIKNEFFGERITVSGLVTATDIIKQLKGKDLGDVLLIPASMLRKQRDMFLDSVTVGELSAALGTEVDYTENDGYELIMKIFGKE